MKKHISDNARAYYDKQQEIMDEMQSILDRRSTTSGAQITAELEALQRRAYPEFYPNEPQPKQEDQEQEDQEQTEEPYNLNSTQIFEGLCYSFFMFIRRIKRYLRKRK